MKETIEYYYNLIIDDLEEQDGKYYFKIDNVHYFFVFYNRGLDELDDLISVSNSMRQKGIDVHKILVNCNNSFLTKVNDYNYLLFCVTNLNEVYDIFDIISNMDKLTLTSDNSKLYRNNWGELWSKKIDYFEIQVRELALNRDVVKNSFSYYIGMSENAISYVNNANMKYGKYTTGKIVLSHRRIFYPNYKLNYLNPLSFIFDLEVRDVAEYLKAMFFSDDSSETLEELSTFLKTKYLDIYEYHMLMARLIYPSYYFDIYDLVMNKDESDEALVKVIKKSEEYEEFLKEAYLEISKYAKLDKISWLID